MGTPKDPQKFAIYCENQRRIALERGFGKWMLGKKLAPESIEKLRLAQAEIGNRPEERQRRSQRAKAKGYGKWMLGRDTSHYNRPDLKGISYEERYGSRAEEEREKRRQGNLERFIGVPRKPKRTRQDITEGRRYYWWRRRVYERDDYTCQGCFVRGVKLQAHHIKSWANFPDLRYEVSNGLTLCIECHKRANHLQREQERV